VAADHARAEEEQAGERDLQRISVAADAEGRPSRARTGARRRAGTSKPSAPGGRSSMYRGVVLGAPAGRRSIVT
jgi:hypothetical protein